MTREETLRIMSVLKGAYPAYYRGMQRAEAESVVMLWSEMLADYPYDLVALAVKRFIALDDKGFPPSIGQVIQGCRAVASPPETRMTEAEAWAMCKKAACNGAYHAKAEFAKLPPILQRIVGSAEVIHEWSQMPETTLDSTVSAYVRRSFVAAQEREEEAQSLPPSLNATIHRLAGQMALEAQTQNAFRLEDSTRPRQIAQEEFCETDWDNPTPDNSGASERFLEALRSIAADRSSPLDDRDERNRAMDAERKARAEAQYQMLKAREVGAQCGS